MDATARNPNAFDVNNRMVLAIAIPMTLGFLTTPLLGLTDTAIIGRSGDPAALAGMAVAAALFDFLFSALGFLRTSTTALVAQAFGRGDRREQQAVFWRAIVISVAMGLVLVALSPLLLPTGLWIMGADGQIAEATRVYFTIRILAAPLSFINFTLLGFVLGRGQGTTGLILQTVLNGTDIVMSILLGITWGYGIAGVAWGTVIGEAVAAIAGICLVLYRYDRTNAPGRAEILDRARLRALFAINRDLVIRSLTLVSAFALVTRIGAGFGPVTMAANAILMNIFLVAGYYLDGFANAAEQITGRAVGAGFKPAFQRAVRLTAIWSFALAAFTTMFFLAFGTTVIDLLTTSAEVRDMAYTYLPWAAVTALSGALAFQMDGVFIGATWSRDMRNMMLCAVAGYLVALAVFVPAFENHGLWLALNLFLAMRGLFLLAVLPRKLNQTFAAHQ